MIERTSSSTHSEKHPMVEATSKMHHHEQEARRLRTSLMFAGHPLNNDKTWTDRSGHTWGLEEMEPSHRANLIAFLERNARGYFYDHDLTMGLAACAWGAPDEALEPDPIFGSDNEQDYVDWIRQTSLLKRLREIEAHDGLGTA